MVVVVVVVRGGLLPAGNDETDGLLRPLRCKFSPAEGERKASRRKEGRGSLMKCHHYRYTTKPTSAPADSGVARVTLLPANTRAS